MENQICMAKEVMINTDCCLPAFEAGFMSHIPPTRSWRLISTGQEDSRKGLRPAPFVNGNKCLQQLVIQCFWFHVKWLPNMVDSEKRVGNALLAERTLYNSVGLALAGCPVVDSIWNIVQNRAGEKYKALLLSEVPSFVVDFLGQVF